MSLNVEIENAATTPVISNYVSNVNIKIDDSKKLNSFLKQKKNYIKRSAIHILL